MKQIIVLEPHEVARLQKGKTLLISSQAGEIGLQFSADDDQIEKVGYTCDICGTTSGIHGKPFSSKMSLARHKMMTHGGKNGKKSKV